MKDRVYSSMSKKNVSTDNDPYLLKKDSHGVAYCKECRGVYKNRYWSFDEEEFKRFAKSEEIDSVICPACKKINDNYPEGIVTLRGDFLQQHKDEILNLIKNEENKAKGINSLERIIEIKEDDGKIVITTTNEKIAQRIGRGVYKAYHGEIEYKWSQDNRMLRVEWER